MEEVGVEPSGLSSCPSFNSYSSDRLAREVEEGINHHHQHHKDTEEDDHYDDFEFFPVDGDVPDDGFVISSDQIGPVFPVFNRDLLLENGYGINGRDFRHSGGGGDVRSIRIPLMDLFMEEDHDPLSSEADNELEGIPEGSYCVWTPRDSVQSSPSWCKKSNSTGSRSSRRWRFLDLLWRSNSDRKESFVFLTPSSNREAKLVKETRNSTSQVRMSGSGSGSESSGNNGKLTAGVAAAERRKGKSALEVFYTRSQVVVRGRGNRRKSYLPYRQDLVGFFANVNNLGRTFPPFAGV